MEKAGLTPGLFYVVAFAQRRDQASLVRSSVVAPGEFFLIDSIALRADALAL